MAEQQYRAAAYCRLSREDGSESESTSISTQKTMLSAYIKEQGWTLVDFYIDDGFSGTNFERPSFKRMIADIEAGKINCVVTKDLSRFGRSYLDCGYYQEIFFPEHRVRYIAVNDGYDSHHRPAMDVTPFRNIMNEMYATDISVKVRSALRAQFKNGKFHGSTPPYGYLKDPTDHNHLVIDPQTAPVVQQIFEMALQGNGVRIIRNYLRANRILRPSAYACKRGDRGYLSLPNEDELQYAWNENAVRMILRNPTYSGNLCGYKRVSPNMKIKRRFCRKPDEWDVIPNTHEGIVPQEIFDAVQKLMNSRQNTPRQNRNDLFAGILHCPDCGQILRCMKAHRMQRPEDAHNYVYICNNYCCYGKNACTQHKIEFENLYRAVLESINQLSVQACSDPQFIQRMQEHLNSGSSANTAQLVGRQKSLLNRLSALDERFNALYEDRSSGRINTHNFDRIAAKYQAEQDQIRAELDSIARTLDSTKDKNRTAMEFTAQIAQFRGVKQLTRSMLLALIEDIRVYDTIENDDGESEQTIEIIYRNMGSLGELAFSPPPLPKLERRCICPACGKEFSATGNRAVYCRECAKARKSAQCRASKIRSRQREKETVRQGHTYGQKICPQCSKPFWPQHSGRQTYCCEECKQLARKATAQRRQANHTGEME